MQTADKMISYNQADAIHVTPLTSLFQTLYYTSLRLDFSQDVSDYFQQSDNGEKKQISFMR